jgi:peptidylprolyl isomerase
MRSPRPRSSRVLILVAASTLAIAACGSDSIDSADSSVDTAPAGSVLASSPDKPTVQIPSELPTTLVITDLTEGTGAAAVAGDTVVVNYVGVRSVDGTEFDNSYDRGETFDVVLGAGSVIQGWDEGLVGIKTGGRRQLDIPADLAYADSPSGDIIQPGDALSFVIDAVAVIGAGDPADAPGDTVEAAPNREQIDIQDVTVGDGPVAQSGQTVAVQIAAYRADTGAKLTATWDDPEPRPFTFAFGNGEILPGIELGLEGMTVGSRRQVAVPYLMAFGDAGNPDFGLPEKTDMVLIIDLVAAY